MPRRTHDDRRPGRRRDDREVDVDRLVDQAAALDSQVRRRAAEAARREEQQREHVEAARSWSTVRRTVNLPSRSRGIRG